jgi:hypothetical protein
MKEDVRRFCTLERKKKGYQGRSTHILYCRKEEERISRGKYADSVLLEGRRKDIKEEVRGFCPVERKMKGYQGSRRKYADYVL